MRSIANKCLRLTHINKFSFIPPSCYKVETKINPIVTVSFGTDKVQFGQLQFRLFQNVVPRTSQNFKRLLLGTAKYQNRSLSLIGNMAHRYVQRGYIQFGNLEDGNCSIFGPKFRDQSFQLLHDRPGLLTSISQQNTNNSRFALTFAPCPFMDYKNIVFGQVTAQSFDTFRKLQRLGSKLGQIKITGTKLLPMQIQQVVHHHH